MTDSKQRERPFRPASAEVLAWLREAYTAPADIRCRVCGAEMMLSNSSTGVYNCTSDAASIVKTDLFTPEGKAAREHYAASAWYDRRRSDKRVLDLLDEIEWWRRRPGTMSDSEAGREYDVFWRELVTTDGQLDEEKILRELADYSWLLRAVPIAYDRATNGRASHPFTLPEIVGQQTEEWFEEASNRDRADLLHDVITEMADVLPDEPDALDKVVRHLQEKLAGLEK